MSTSIESVPQLLNVQVREGSRGGYYLELFLDSDLDELTCPICREGFFEPVRTECGHSFCHACIQALIDNNPPFGYKVNPVTAKGKCPVDRSPISVIFQRDSITEKKLLTRKVRCPLQTRGCEWEGSLLMLETHLINDCLKLKVECNHSECGAMVERCDLSKHIKDCTHGKENN